MDLRFNIQNTTYGLILVCLVVFILSVAKGILMPIAFSIFLAFMLMPIASFFERRLHLHRIISIILTFLVVVLVIGGLVWFFSAILLSMSDSVGKFQAKLDELLRLSEAWLADFVPGLEVSNGEDLKNRILKAMGGAGTSMFSSTLSMTLSTLAFIGLVPIYTFLFLLYRTSFKDFFMLHFPSDEKVESEELLGKIQKVSQQYFYGMMLVILVVGIMNSIGLYAIGLDYAIFFAFLAAILTIVPYVGTTLGMLIPFFFALVNYDGVWMAVSVIVVYQCVQAIENNIITPSIVGRQVSLNPLVAIIALIIGGTMWGVVGLILFIPLFAMIKVVCDHVTALKPYGILLGSHFGDRDKGDRKLKSLNKGRYTLFSRASRKSQSQSAEDNS